MALREFQCVECEKKFVEGKWEDANGHRHTLPGKTYYILTNGLTVCYSPERKFVNSLGQGNLIPARFLTFDQGTYITTDPEQQAFLDRYKACVPYDRWADKNISEKERLAIMASKARTAEATVKAQNDELEALKKRIAELEAK